MRVYILFLITFFAAVSCSDPNEAKRQYLSAEIERIGKNYQLAAQELPSKQQRVNFLQEKLQEQNAELADYNRKFNAYIMDHKMAVAAIAAGVGGTAIAYDPNNEFSDEVQVVSGIVGLFAVAWALGNMEEVAQVADQLAQADQYVKSLKAQIESNQIELTNLSDGINKIKVNLESIQAEYDLRNAELAALR